MISKGFNFPKLNCVVVVDADFSGRGYDLRTTEKNIQLYHQLSGRAGRFSSKSLIIYQTLTPNDSTLNELIKNKSEELLKNELMIRKKNQLPPFIRLIAIIISSNQHDLSIKGAKEIKVSPEWPTTGSVSFDKVMLRYRPELDHTLKKLSFNIESGHKVGVVGRTGAGKSTMCLVISRILELEQGKIEIDGIETSKVNLNTLRSKITVIPQDPVIFDGTLKFNLDPSGTIPDKEIEAILLEAGLDDLLKRTPEKKIKKDSELDTGDDAGNGRGIYFKLNDGGSSLSTGEKQLICICRAVLRKNKIIILDEATANIDIKTEEKI